MAKQGNRVAALTAAGSDSGGGAGIQADLKTFHALGVHGVCGITCVTAQNPQTVSGVQAVSTGMIQRQLDTVSKGFKIKAAKTGMLFSKTIIDVVAGFFQSNPKIRLVVDPVMVSTSGAILLKKEAIRIMENRLFPLATLITPNLDEASLLLKEEIDAVEKLPSAAVQLYNLYGKPILLKGGHLKGLKEAADVFYDGHSELLLTAPFVKNINTHGTGCTYSAAIAAFLSQGQSIEKSVLQAKKYITGAIQNSVRVGDQWVLNWNWMRKIKKI